MTPIERIQAAIDNLEAQLAILRHGGAYYEGDPSLLAGVIKSADRALALADSILGADS